MAKNKTPKGKLTRLPSKAVSVEIFQGSQGDQGPIGTAGPRGETGGVGSHGTDGPLGPQGLRGDVGVAGPSGSQGNVGPQGIQGTPGPQGEVGLPPNHRWVGNKLQFKLPDGTWGRATDLTGPDGGHREHGHGGNEQRVSALLLAGNILTLEQLSGGISIPDVTVDLSTLSAAITLEDEGIAVAGAPHSTLDFVGAGVTVTNAGGGTATITIPGAATDFPEFQFNADNMQSPTNADWVVAQLAPLSADASANALSVRLFDDVEVEGAGFELEIPSGATSIVLSFKARAVTAPGAAATVGLELYNRGIPDNAAVEAWSSATTLTDIDIPTNAFFQYDTQTITLASLGVTAGELTKFELTRVDPTGGTELVGDWALVQIKVGFV